MITRTLSSEVTIRQPGRCLQIFVYLGITCVFWVPGLIGIGALIWLNRPAGLACLAVAVLAVAWGSIRAIRMHVRFDDCGVTIRNFWRTRSLSWDEVSHLADGGKDWWALKVVPRSGRPIEASATTSGAKGIAKTGVLDVIGQVAARYHVTADLSGRTLVARATNVAAGRGTAVGSMTAHDADLGRPAGSDNSWARPQRPDEPAIDGDANRAAPQPPGRASYRMSLACLVSAIVTAGLGITDLIAYGILPGYIVGLGMASGASAAILASITWFGMVAPKSATGPQTEVIRRVCRAAQTLGILGFICLAIGSGNGSTL